MRRHALTLALSCAALLLACKHEIRCPQGETACGDQCVSLLTSIDHCGTCGVAGKRGLQQCRAGSLGCAPGVPVCDGACTDLARDPAHCGDCGTACGQGQLCLTDDAGTRCADACPEGWATCGGACVALDGDPMNCGACGRACDAGQTCRAGACTADLEVACYASGDVRPVTTDLEPAGAARVADGSPIALAVLGGAVYSGNGYPGGVTVFPLDDRLARRVVPLSGNDVEGITAYAGTVLVVNAAANALAVLDAGGAVLDEFAMPGDAPNPHGVAVAGTTAYVSLYGDGPDGFGGHPRATGQRIALVDLSALPGCVAGTSERCGAVTSSIDLLSVAGSADAGGYPFPSKLAVHGSRVYATLANLKRADCGGQWYGYCQPAGNGKLAVIDPAAANVVSIVDLGPQCRNPGDIHVDGDVAWISCGSFGFRTEAPGAVVPVDLSGATPVVGTALDLSGIVPGGLAICGGMGYVTDQGSGAVLRFNTTTRHVDAPVTVCPTVYFAWAADVACSAP